VSAIPDGLVLARHRDGKHRSQRPWARWALLAVVLVLPVLALANVFGQRPHTAVALGRRASLEVEAPTRVRGGLLWQARVNIRAHEVLRQARLVLSSGWLESMQTNTLEPAPTDETSTNGSPAFTLGQIAEGQKFVFYMQFQVNPTNVGRRAQTLELYDGAIRVLRLERTITVFP